VEDAEINLIISNILLHYLVNLSLLFVNFEYSTQFFIYACIGQNNLHSVRR